jgi:hypothetical protein
MSAQPTVSTNFKDCWKMTVRTMPPRPLAEITLNIVLQDRIFLRQVVPLPSSTASA